MVHVQPSTPVTFNIPKQGSVRERIDGLIRKGESDFESLYCRLERMAENYPSPRVTVGIEKHKGVLSRLDADSPVARLRVSRANQYVPEGESVTVHHIYFSSGRVQESIYRL